MDTYMRELFIEVVELCAQSLPSMSILLLDYGMWLVDLIMLGHLGKGHLASGSLAITYFLMNWVFIEGILTAYETLSGYITNNHISNSTGKNNNNRNNSKNSFDIRLITYSSIYNAIIVSCLCTGVIVASPWVFDYVFSDNEHVVFKASEYILVLIPCLWICSFNRIISKYFQFTKKMKFVLVGNLIGFVLNLLGNYILMYASGVGFIGCAIVSIIARLTTMVVYVYILANQKHSQQIKEEVWSLCWLCLSCASHSCWCVRCCCCSRAIGVDATGSGSGAAWSSVVPVSSDVELTPVRSSGKQMLTNAHVAKEEVDEESTGLLSAGDDTKRSSSSNNSLRERFLADPWPILRPRLVRQLLLGVPGGMMLGLDASILYVMGLCIANMGSVPLDTHEILTAVCNFVYMTIVFAIANVVAFRISNFIVIGNIHSSRITAHACLCIGAIAAVVTCGLVYLLSFLLADLFTSDNDVKGRVITLATIAVCFQFPFALTGAISGVLRGLGHHYLLAKISFLALWLAGLPTGLYLNYYARPTFGLNGIWYGLVIGATMQFLVVVIMFVRIDWKREVAVAVLKRDRKSFRTAAARPSRGRGQRGGDGGDGKDSDTLATTAAVSIHWTEEEELEELEKVSQLETSYRAQHNEDEVEG